MKFTELKWAALIATAVLTGCSDNKNDIDNPDGPQGSGTMEVMTPEESKEFLENTAVDFLNQFNPQDQKAFIELAAYYDYEYADYELPASFFGSAYPGPANYIHQLAKAAKGDIDALTRAANAFSFTIKFDNFAGIYEPDEVDEMWVKKAESKDLIFRFQNVNGQPVELKIAQSGGTSDFDFSFSDWNGEYDPETGIYNDVEETYTVYLSIPKNITTTLTENGKQLASTTVVSSIDVKGHKISANVDATLMNLRSTVKIDGNDKKVESKTELFVNNNSVASGYATIEGDGLCDIDRYKELDDSTDDLLHGLLAKMLKKGECGFDLLGKVQIYAQATYYNELPLDIVGAYNDYVFDSNKSEAQIACQKACDRLNKNIKTQLRYNGTKTDQATLFFQPRLEDDMLWWEFMTDCVLLFPDGTKYSMDKYFSNLSKVEGKFDSLLEAYMSIWQQARR